MSKKVAKKKTTKKKSTKKKQAVKKKPVQAELPVDIKKPEIPEDLGILVKPDADSLNLLERKVFEAKVYYSPTLASEIVERVFNGERLSKICKSDGMPSLRDCYKWLKDYPIFRDNYEIARNAQALNAFENVLDLAEEAKYSHKDGIPGLKLSADLNKWVAERGDRNRYASNPEKENSGVVINISTGIQRNPDDPRTFDEVVSEIRNLNESE